VTSPLASGVGLAVAETREVGRLDGRDALRLSAGLAPIASEEESRENRTTTCVKLARTPPTTGSCSREMGGVELVATDMRSVELLSRVR
jgi:hypothetical protein